MIERVRCPRGCCSFYKIYSKWKERSDCKSWYSERGKRVRAGVVMYCTSTQKVLIVQNYNYFFGFPKGGVETDENLVDCACRELEEETGIRISPSELKGDCLMLDETAYYYIMFVDKEYEVRINTSGTDATGAGWIKLSCLYYLEKFGVYTKHLKTMLTYLFDINL